MFVDRTDFSMVTIDVEESGAITERYCRGHCQRDEARRRRLAALRRHGARNRVRDRRAHQPDQAPATPSSAVIDLSVSRDGKTLYTIDGSNDVTRRRSRRWSERHCHIRVGPARRRHLARQPGPVGLAERRGVQRTVPGRRLPDPIRLQRHSDPGQRLAEPDRIQPARRFLVTIDGATNKIYVLK